MAYGTKEAQIAATVKLFWAKVRKSDDANGCWIWTGFCNPGGYGVHGRGELFPKPAHRMSFTLATGYRPRDDEYVLHSCDTPACVNPAHLRLGNAKDNANDAKSRGRHASKERHGMWGGQKAARGERQGASKLKDSDIIFIRANAKAGNNMSAVARQVGIAYPTLKRIVRGLAWTHVGMDVPAAVKTCYAGHEIDQSAPLGSKRSRPCAICDEAAKAAKRLRDTPVAVDWLDVAPKGEQGGLW